MKTDAARGDKMQIWRRNFLSMFSGGAQFGEWLEPFRRKRRQSGGWFGRRPSLAALADFANLQRRKKGAKAVASPFSPCGRRWIGAQRRDG
ncbi:MULTISPECIES: hypothetical protein [unclassified Mesorhizobium]|uniref:hypothetical protein n=1 Tax=unclassified Mesorhizobium TaxID=325217 RepID=UPI000F75EAA3|nr:MULTISPECIES: hypothetical protein [unclassified Mesorhizobium]AZO26850.1 hypothetical protein EJ071_04710 [Mesorhizobium sp. M1B.F.Ca.ET.045.04.1.1]